MILQINDLSAKCSVDVQKMTFRLFGLDNEHSSKRRVFEHLRQHFVLKSFIHNIVV